VFSAALLTALAANHLYAQSLPLALEGNLGDAAYKINVPADWNGTLVLFEDGYRDVADAPGETEDRAAHFDPPELEQYLLANHYATASSGFSANGYNIDEGEEDTKALLSFFRDMVGKPRHTILYGLSGGSVRSNVLLETGHGLIDAAIDTCSVNAGTPLFFDRALDFAVAYDAAFGWPVAWGSPGDVRDDLDFEIDVLPTFLDQIFNPANAGKLEFIRTVNGISPAGFYDGEGLFIWMFFTTEARAQVERKLGGPATQNLDHTYRLSNADKGYLASLGEDPDALLSSMNAHAIYGAKRSARQYMENGGSFNGNITGPILSMHAIDDGLATIDHESVYAAINAAAGRQDVLTQVYTNGVGHCTFTEDQLESAVRAMVSWLETGVKPDATFFPVSQGFVPGFTPPAWPYPIK
jgi:hypothetical protein